MTHFITSDFRDNNGKGSFYPAGMPERVELTCYTREFNTSESNSTFHPLPKPRKLDSATEKTFVPVNNRWREPPVTNIRQLQVMLD